MYGTVSKSLVASQVIFSEGGPASGSPTWVAIAELDEAPYPKSKWDFEEVTNFGSPANASGSIFKERVTTLLDPGTQTIKGNFIDNDAGQTALANAQASGVLTWFKVTMPINPKIGQTTVGNTAVFAAFVASFAPDSLQVGKTVKFSVDLQLSGAPTITPGS